MSICNKLNKYQYIYTIGIYITGNIQCYCINKFLIYY